MGTKARNKKEKREQQAKDDPSFGQPGWTQFAPFVVKSFAEVPEGREWLGDNVYRIGAEVFRIFRNSRYSVMVGRPAEVASLNVKVVHLSIKRLDRAPIHDWRDLQRIKNELVGPECEGIELYPAESRLMDESNQYHLYVVVQEGYRLPFGYQCERMVSNQATWPTAKQRPLQK